MAPAIAEWKLPVSMPTTASMTAPLLRHVPAAFVNIAPERLDELKAAWPGMSLTIVDVPRFVCHYTPQTKVIMISTGVVEVLWAASHAYIILHDRVLAKKQAARPLVIDLHVDPVVKDAMGLLKWGVERLIGTANAPWPSNGLRPSKGISSKSLASAL